MKKHTIRLIDLASRPTQWAARLLTRLFKHDPKKSQLVIGFVLLAAGCVLENLWKHHLLIQVMAAEPCKAVGAAPICRIIIDFLEWEA